MYDEAAAVPIILALVEVGKRIGIPTTFSPLVAIAFGILYALATRELSLENGLIGLAIGLSASGLYSGGKTVFKKNDN